MKSNKIRAIAKHGIIASARLKDSEITCGEALLTVRLHKKTFKAGLNKLGTKNFSVNSISKDDIALSKMMQKERNIAIQTMYLSSLKEIDERKKSMYVSKEHKAKTKAKRAAARNTWWSTHNDRLSA